MARRAFSSQCQLITIVILLAVFAGLISYPYHSGTTTSVKFRYGRDTRHASRSDDATFEYNGIASRGHVKRLMAPMSSLNEAFAHTVQGCQMTDLMLADEATVHQIFGDSVVSKWWINDLLSEASGWTRSILDESFDPNSIAPYLSGLNNVDGFSHRGVRITTDKKWVRTDYTQSSRYRRDPNGQYRAPTWGNYEMISTVGGSRSAGVIIILSAFSPEFQTSQLPGGALPTSELPQISLWSDVGYIEYGRVSTYSAWTPLDDPAVRGMRPSRFRTPPSWILVPKVWGPPEALSVISHCLFTVYGLNDLPTWQNRVTFPIGSLCFYAITGTPQGKSLSWFFITHKYRMQQSTLGSVTIFGSGFYGDHGYEIPSMLYWAVSNVQKTHPGAMTIVQIRMENSAHAAMPDSDLANFPYPLRPV